MKGVLVSFSGVSLGSLSDPKKKAWKKANKRSRGRPTPCFVAENRNEHLGLSHHPLLMKPSSGPHNKYLYI